MFTFERTEGCLLGRSQTTLTVSWIFRIKIKHCYQLLKAKMKIFWEIFKANKWAERGKKEGAKLESLG